VATLLADPPAAPGIEQPSASEFPGAPPAPAPASGAASGVPPTPQQRSCANCGAPLLGPGQDWCLQCGAGAPGSLGAHTPSWRSAATVIGATALLAVGAAAAAYAALSREGPHKAHPVITTVARIPALTATTPVTPTTPGGVTVPTPKTFGTTPATTPTTANPFFPSGTTKPPKIPLTAATPKSSSGTKTTTPATPGGGETAPTTTPTKSTAGSTPTTEAQPTAILLDTNAAATYNPYGYPASDFGDPSLAIDGDASTAWTAQVNPAVAPKMAEGVVIDLKTAQKLSALELTTTTPGMTVQVYGANGHTLPASITDPAWHQLSPYRVERKKHVRIKFTHPKTAFRFITLWISKAPAGSIGTSQAPGHVSINEIELLPTI
jgi:hypothetical protein